MKRSAPHSAVGVLALWMSAPVAGQAGRALVAPPEYTVQQWTTEDGLPQNSVNAIVQAPDGHLWLGTFGGLVRFDGARFGLVERTDSGGSRLDRVLSLAVDRDGALWIGTEDGLLRRRAGAYQVYTAGDGLPDVEVTALAVGVDGALWVGTARGGLARFEDGRFTAFTEAAGEPIGPVESIVVDSNGTVWVSSTDRFITIEGGTPSTARWSAFPAPGVIHRVLLDRAGASWYSLRDGLARLAGDSVRVFGQDDGVPEPSVMVEDPVDGYWLGTRNDGLYRFRADAQSVTMGRYALPDGRLEFRVRTALLDEDGNVWIGTNASGLLRVKRKVFTTYSSEHGLSHDVITAVLEGSDGTHWVGTNCGGVNALDLEARTVRVLNPRSPGDPEGDPCIFALAETPSGVMWQGTWGGGVSLLVGDPGTWPTHIAGLPDSVILALQADRGGNLWVGMNSGGLAAVKDGRVRAVYTTADGLAHNSVRTIFQASNDDLWIGTLGGLSRVRGGRVDTPAAAPLAGTHVRAIHQDVDGDLWVGTYGAGLYRLRGDTTMAITSREGLAEDVVSSILEDGRGSFWMSGNHGIQRVARSELVAVTEGVADHVHSVLYGVADGLRNAETNGGFQPAALKDGAGRLWFPTLEGVAVVDPGRILADERPPTVSIEEVVVDGESRSPGALEPLGPDRPNLEFRYTGLSLSAPEHVTFRYRLEGFDQDWVEAGRRRVAYYPRLEPGMYRFVVNAANRDGVWSPVEASLPLRVNPPFWSAWWFRVGALLGLLGLGVVLARRYEKAARRDREAKDEFSRRLIESQEHERKRLAGELHDGLGQSLLIVRNRALLALRARDDTARVQDQLRQITDVVADSLRSVRELAHNLTPHELDHLGLSAALRAMTDAVAETTDIALDSAIEDIDDLLPIDEEINLYRVVQEALSNVVRHSDAATASVRVRRTGSRIRVSVVDDGRGFAHPGRDRGREAGFGLSGMAERARILGGRFEITSAPGQGTRIDLSVPVTEPRPAAEPGSRGGAA